MRDQSFLESFNYTSGVIQTTRADTQLTYIGSGKYKEWSDIKVCPDSIKNICSGGVLRDMGYGLFLMRIPRVVRLYDGAEVLTATYSENGMPYVGLHELLNLPNINQDSEIK